MKIIGTGNTAEVFEYEKGKVCKLFVAGYPKEYVELEYRNAMELFRLGIRVPQPFEVVVVSGRNGIVYEKIEGVSLSQYLLERRECLADCLDEFARLHKEILKQKSTNLLSYKEFLKGMLVGKGAKYAGLFEKIQMLPEGEAVLHGDFHANNVLITKEGNFFAIDFMNVCYGPALFDVARTYHFMSEIDAAMADDYLRRMDVEKEALGQYLDIVRECRKYEAWE